MERAVTRPRSRQGPRLVTITPAADGWRVGALIDGEPARLFPTLDEAAAALPENSILRFSLPVSNVLLERMHLPSTDREELSGMVLLQLEKSLPYGVEEQTSGFDLIQQGETESDILAVAIGNAQLDELCQPLRAHRKLPDQVSVFAIQLAATFPGEEVLALIFREPGATILAIAQNGKLVAAHPCATADRDEFLAELPRLLLAAELEGAPVNFSKLAVERDLADWMPAIKEQFPGVPALLVPVDGTLELGPVNLLPSGWTQERQKQSQQARLREWLTVAGAVYLFFLLAAAGYIIWLQHRVGAIDAQVVAQTPAVDSIGSEKARWTALQPAIDPTRYTVELLQQIYKSIPSDDLRVTVFDQSPVQFMVEGEAPTAGMAIQYMDALKANTDLNAFHLDAGPPEILPNEHAHFRIFAKL